MQMRYSQFKNEIWA